MSMHTHIYEYQFEAELEGDSFDPSQQDAVGIY